MPIRQNDIRKSTTKLITEWTTRSITFVRIISVSSENVAYGWPFKLMFDRLYRDLSIFKLDKKASVRATTMARIFEIINNFTLNVDGDIAEVTPMMPHTQNTAPHQIPWPYS